MGCRCPTLTAVTTSFAAREREALADAMLAAGPDAPTLCEGWTVSDLAAHVVIRERRPDTAPGILLPGFSAWTAHVLRRTAQRPLADLVAAFRAGPPPWSPFALPGVDAAANLGEYFVHTEDVLRARPGAVPRELPAEESDALWRMLTGRSRMLLARARTGVVLATPDGRRHVARRGTPAVTLTGEPGELVLYLFGRCPVARVEVTGDDDAVTRFADCKLGF